MRDREYQREKMTLKKVLKKVKKTPKKLPFQKMIFKMIKGNFGVAGHIGTLGSQFWVLGPGTEVSKLQISTRGRF